MLIIIPLSHYHIGTLIIICETNPLTSVQLSDYKTGTFSYQIHFAPNKKTRKQLLISHFTTFISVVGAATDLTKNEVLRIAALLS